MGIHSFESYNREQRRGHLRAVKRNLVFSVFKRIDEHLQENPHVDSFTTPLLVKEGIEATYVRALLRDCPESVARPIQPRIGREILLRLDELVEPPLLTVELPTSS